MAQRYAKLDENNIVTQIVKVGNDVPTSDGPLGENDMHVDGETYCTNLFGGRWKQCSATNAFRKQNAGIGQTYDSVKDKFIKPQPFPSWTLNESTCQWEAPIAYPGVWGSDVEGKYVWNEETQSWDDYPQE